MDPKFISIMNGLLTSIAQAVNGALSITDNLYMEVVSVRASHGVAVNIRPARVRQAKSAALLGCNGGIVLGAPVVNPRIDGTIDVTVWFSDPSVANAPVSFLILEEGSLADAIPTLTLPSAILATPCITSAHLFDSSVLTAKLADNAVATAKLADVAVTSAKIADAAVSLAKFASGLRPVQVVGALPGLPNSTYPQGATVFLTTDNKLYRSDGSNWVATVPTTDLSGQITTTQITDNAVTTAKINANAVTAGKIAAGTITSTEIATDTILAGNIAAGAIGTSELAANAVTAGKIASHTITANEITAGTITSTEIASHTITAANIQATTITSAELASNSITAVKITADNIVANHLTTGLLDGSCLWPNPTSEVAPPSSYSPPNDGTDAEFDYRYNAGAGNAFAGSYVRRFTRSTTGITELHCIAPASPGQHYRLSCQAKFISDATTGAGAALWAQVEFLDASLSHVGPGAVALEIPSAQTTWSPLEPSTLPLGAPSDTCYVKMSFYLQTATNGAAEAWVDAIDACHITTPDRSGFFPALDAWFSLSSQTIATGTETVVKFNISGEDGAHDYNSSYGYSQTTGKYTALVSGWYLVDAAISFTGSGGDWTISLYIGSTLDRTVTVAAPAAETPVRTTALVQLNASSTLEIRAKQTSGGNLDTSQTRTHAFLKVKMLPRWGWNGT